MAEMAYSQALQAGGGLDRRCVIPGSCSSPRAIGRSELIKTGQSVGVAQAEHYYPATGSAPAWQGDPQGLPALQDSIPAALGAGGPAARGRWNLQHPRPHQICRLDQFLGPAACWWPTSKKGWRVCQIMRHPGPAAARLSGPLIGGI